MNEVGKEALSKVPEVTLVFWIINILATTLGETGGDAVSMSLGLGYLLSTGIFLVIFIIAVIVQIKAIKFHPVIYWATIIATTTLGTTIADYADRSLGIGYLGGSILLLALLLGSLFLWKIVDVFIIDGMINGLAVTTDCLHLSRADTGGMQ